MAFYTYASQSAWGSVPVPSTSLQILIATLIFILEGWGWKEKNFYGWDGVRKPHLKLSGYWCRKSIENLWNCTQNFKMNFFSFQLLFKSAHIESMLKCKYISFFLLLSLFVHSSWDIFPSIIHNIFHLCCPQLVFPQAWPLVNSWQRADWQYGCQCEKIWLYRDVSLVSSQGHWKGHFGRYWWYVVFEKGLSEP